MSKEKLKKIIKKIIKEQRAQSDKSRDIKRRSGSSSFKAAVYIPGKGKATWRIKEIISYDEDPSVSVVDLSSSECPERSSSVPEKTKIKRKF